MPTPKVARTRQGAILSLSDGHVGGFNYWSGYKDCCGMSVLSGIIGDYPSVSVEDLEWMLRDLPSRNREKKHAYTAIFTEQNLADSKKLVQAMKNVGWEESGSWVNSNSGNRCTMFNWF